MKNTFLGLLGMLAIGASVALLTTASRAEAPPPLPTLPKNCVFLKEVSTGEIQIRKISQFGNENVDFAVPTGVRFKSYIAELLPENNANYRANLYFKYNDNSNARVFSKTIAAQRFKRYSAPFRSPTGRQPTQINFNVSSDRNNAYQVAVAACK